MASREPQGAHESAPFRMPAEPAPVEFLAKYFRALGDPTRLRVLQLLAERERSVGEITAELKSVQPKVSHHLACLRWCGFVTSRREHRTVYYSVADERVLAMLNMAEQLLHGNAEHLASCRVID